MKRIFNKYNTTYAALLETLAPAGRWRKCFCRAYHNLLKPTTRALQNNLCLAILILFYTQTQAQTFRQQANFIIDVTLNDKEHTLDGFEKITYTNHSPDTLHYIWFHIWPNAFKNDQTAFSEQLLLNNRTDFYFSNKDKRGYINRLNFKVDGTTAKTEDHPQYIDVIKLILPSPLLPQQTIQISTPFHIQIPYNFSGNGRTGQYYQITQWFPRPALYNEQGWHPAPYLGEGNHNHEYGSYDVRISVPRQYPINTTAVLKDTSINGQLVTWHYQQANSNDFTWTAGITPTPKKKKQTLPWQPNNDTLYKKIAAGRLFNLVSISKNPHIALAPAVGYNMYDGFMIGGLLHNYQQPQPAFRFFLAPLYATNSKTISGIGQLSYNWYPQTKIKQVELGADLAKFTANELVFNDVKNYYNFSKLAPYIRISLKEKNATSKTQRYLQYKSFFLREQGYNIRQVINGTDTSLQLFNGSANRTVQQLTLVFNNQRILYPYQAAFSIEQGKDFMRAAFDGQYFFNYANRQGGMHVRLFAGKFFYLGSQTGIKQLQTDRYHLNLTGPDGYEDYTYSNYYIGRHKFEGLGSQQIMQRDGFFKVRTDLLGSKVGKTDQWLSAMNFTTDIPSKINPLSLLGIRLKAFADIGTFAEAWKSDSPYDKFLYDAGLQLPLLKESINIYIPLFYSSVFKDYYTSILGEKNFWKKISFSINLERLLPLHQ